MATASASSMMRRFCWRGKANNAWAAEAPNDVRPPASNLSFMHLPRRPRPFAHPVERYLVLGRTNARDCKAIQRLNRQQSQLVRKHKSHFAKANAAAMIKLTAARVEPVRRVRNAIGPGVARNLSPYPDMAAPPDETARVRCQPLRVAEYEIPPGGSVEFCSIHPGTRYKRLQGLKRELGMPSVDRILAEAGLGTNGKEHQGSEGPCQEQQCELRIALGQPRRR